MRDRVYLGVGLSFLGAVVTLWSAFAALALLSAFRNPIAAPELWALTAAIGSGGAVLACDVALLMWPRHSTALGALITVFSILGLFGYFGVCCAGPFAGVFGGLLAILHSRTRPADIGPTSALVLGLTSAFFIEAGAVFGTFGPYPFPKSPLLDVAIGLACGLSAVGASLLQYARPRFTPVTFVVLTIASLASFLGAYAGFLGGCLGFVSAVVALESWYANSRTRVRVKT